MKLKRAYHVGFLCNGVIKKVLRIHAFNQLEAYSTAEEIYKACNWQFGYDDMYCDLLTF